MANRYLLPVYQKLYDEDFDYADFDKRMKMQKAVYLLQDMGVPMGGYGFRWYLHGPYSQDLQDDMHELKNRRAGKVKIAPDCEARIKKLAAAIRDEGRGGYSEAEWVECLGSMRYLQKRVLRFDAAMEDVLNKLAEKKPHLKDRAANTAAYRLLEELFA